MINVICFRCDVHYRTLTLGTGVEIIVWLTMVLSIGYVTFRHRVQVLSPDEYIELGLTRLLCSVTPCAYSTQSIAVAGRQI